MLIRSFGLFWRREPYGFEWPRSGQLLGLGVRQKRLKPVDFSQQRGVYALYDDSFRLIYVGQVGRGDRGLRTRLRSHTRNNLAERWSRFSWFGILPAADEIGSTGFRELSIDRGDLKVSQVQALDHIEAVLIAASEPLKNTKSGSFGKEATQYRQLLSETRLDEEGEDEVA